MNMKAVIIILVVIILGAALLGSCAEDTEYEKAGKEFGSGVNTDPNKWTDTQKEYFNDFSEWAAKNEI